jgi:excisionase family DNA binding protein
MSRLYDVKDPSTILKVKPSTLYTWVCQGKIPHIRIGRLIRFIPEEIADLLQRKK